MKHLRSSVATKLAFLAAIACLGVALIVVGCGGSGITQSTPTLNNLGTPRIEAIVLVSTSNLKNPGEFTATQLLDPTNKAVQADLIVPSVFGFQDLSNFQTGEDYVFQLVAYGAPSSGNPYGRVILGATFGTSDTLGTYGTLAANSGVYLAAHNATSSPLSIYASYNGQSYSSQFQIKPRQSRVIGTVASANSTSTVGAPVSGTVVQFYDANGDLTGSVTSAVDGTYRASIPTSSVNETVDPHSLSIAFYDLFEIGTTIYSAGAPGCRALLPTITTGTQTLRTILIVPTTMKAPTPTGCSS